MIFSGRLSFQTLVHILMIDYRRLMPLLAGDSPDYIVELLFTSSMFFAEENFCTVLFLFFYFYFFFSLVSCMSMRLLFFVSSFSDEFSEMVCIDIVATNP